ncbi:MAG: dATP/dGTP diphosphohydrolase domain-containing protein [Solibacillus sp.]
MKIRMLEECVFNKGGTPEVKFETGDVLDFIHVSDTHYTVIAEGKNRYIPKEKAIVMAREFYTSNNIVEGVSPDQPIIYNEKGGGQSDSPYRMDLVDPKSVLEIAKVLKTGADKYGDDNWKLISTQDHLNHLLVHVYAHLAGDESDKHLAHAACRAIFALGVELEDK